MGELIDLNPKGTINAADIPAEIARDIETTAAITAHVTDVDPHAQYLLQAEGDARYPRFSRKIYTLTTGSTQGAMTSIAHGLDATKIQSVSAFVFVNLSTNAGFAPRILPGGIAGLTGHHYSITIDMGNIVCRLSPTDSGQILNRTVTVSIDWF